MESTYKKNQFGLLSIIIFLFVGLLLSIVARTLIGEGRLVSVLIMFSVYLLGLVMFSWSTIEIKGGKLIFWFGLRVIKRTIDLREIQATDKIRNPWYFFWGVKAIPGGWLYAVAPGLALEIKLANGKIVQFGTDQPGKLKQAINAARQQLG